MSDHVFATEPGWEQRLTAELGRVFPGTAHEQFAPGWVESNSLKSSELNTSPCIAFATQALPNAARVDAKSIAGWVRAVGPQLIDGLREHTGPWRLHVFSLSYDVSDPPVSAGRRRLIDEQLHALLKEKQRRLLRSESAASGPWLADEALVQVALVTGETGFCSVCLPPLRKQLARIVSPFPGGVVEILPDRDAPSRAFAKLLEAELRINRRITAGETCVDLGSSPGSWVYVALRRGAKVVAIDRSPLRPDLMANPALDFQRGDAFRFESTSPVDWLLCDVIAAPERSCELLERWIERRWCRHFCVTIKFQGDSDDEVIEPLKGFLNAAGADFLIRRLTNNKNEVTAMGTLM